MRVFIQTSMLVFILVSMVSPGSQTQAHIYIRDHKNQEILSTPEMLV